MLFALLHSSERKFAPAQYVNKERFLSPYLYSLFVICSSARATRTVFCSSFVRSSFVFCSSFVRLFFICLCGSHRLLFVLCSFFVRLLFVFCSSFVRLLFVFSLSTRAARTVFCSFIFLSHFSVTTLPLLGRGLGRGYFLRSLFICPCGSHRLLFVFCSLFHYLPVWLAPSFYYPYIVL